MRQTDLQILDDLIGDDFKPYIESALKRIRSVYVESRPTVRRVRPRNTGSPKFPLDELKRYRKLFSHSRYCDYDNSVGASALVEFVERKLRASA